MSQDPATHPPPGNGHPSAIPVTSASTGTSAPADPMTGAAPGSNHPGSDTGPASGSGQPAGKTGPTVAGRDALESDPSIRRPAFRPSGFTIKLKLSLYFLLASLIPLGVLGWQSYEVQKQVISREVKRGHLELSNVLAHGIFQNLEHTRRLLKAVTEVQAIRTMDPVVARDFFQSLLANFPVFRVLYLVNNRTEIVASTDPKVRLPDGWLWSNAVRRSYQGALSDISVDRDDRPTLTLESLIVTSEQGIGGVLISEVDLTYVRDLLREALKRGSRSQCLVLDEKAAVIAKSSPEVETVGIDRLNALDEDVAVVRDIQGVTYLLTAVSLKKFNFYQAPNWTIVLQIPEALAFDAAYELGRRILWLLAATAAITFILALLIANSFVGPLHNLIVGARRLGAGDFDHAVVPTSADEIGELTRTFDDMRVSLRKTRADLRMRIEHLETLYEVGKAISSILDFNQLQHTILETVVKVMRAEKGSLMLLDDQEKTLTIGVALGLSDEVVQKTRVGRGEPIAGYVIDTGKPLFIEDVESDPLFTTLKRDRIASGTMICVPLRAKDKLLGVINVSRSTPHSFSGSGFELFMNLANQAAIAIENARLYLYAVTDEMTRVYNHRYFQQRLDEEMQRADRYDSIVSLVMMDVDHFKKFNDTYGHAEGDRVLKTVARAIQSSVREIDIVARYGGEEFVVILPEKEAEGAIVPADRIRTTIENHDFRINGERVPITISLGVCSYPNLASNKRDLIIRADTALYYSKGNGRNRVTCFTPDMKPEDIASLKKPKG